MAAKFITLKRPLEVIVILLALGSPVAGQRVDDALIIKQTLSAQLIRQAGVTSLADLLELADDWRLTSVDGFSWQASPNGLSSFTNQSWLVLINGQRIDYGALGTFHLNLLPVSPALIDSIEILSLPVLYEGQFADKGLIHIYTKRPREGLSVYGSGIVGQKTGDPGPYAFTHYSTTNVDKMGSSGFVALDYGAPGWSSRLHLKLNQYPFTYSVLQQQNKKVIAEWPGLFNLTPTLNIRLDRENHQHELLATGSISQKHFFLYFPPLAREVPTNSTVGHVGLYGRFDLSPRADLKYRLRHGVNRYSKYPNTDNLDLDWGHISSSAGIEWNSQGKLASRQIGAVLERNALQTAYRLDQDQYLLVRLYGRLGWGAQSGRWYTLAAYLTRQAEQTAVKGQLSSRWRIATHQVVRTNLAYSERLPAEDGGWTYWSSLGYNLLADNNIAYYDQATGRTSRLATADIQWQMELGPALALQAGINFRRHTDFQIQQQSFQLLYDDCSLYAPSLVLVTGDGSVAGASVGLVHRAGGKLSQRLHYGFIAAATGDARFTSHWETIPQHSLSYQLSATPLPDLTIWTRLSYLTSSNWSTYSNIDSACNSGQLSGAYPASKLKGYAVWDIQLQKHFWRRRLLGALLLKNVTNADMKLHPVGASFDLSFFVRVSLLLVTKSIPR